MPGPRPPPPVVARALGPIRWPRESKPSTPNRRGPSRVRRGARRPRPPRPTRKASRKAVRERWRRWTRAPEVGPVAVAAAARGSGRDGSTREAAPSGRRVAAARLRLRDPRRTTPSGLGEEAYGAGPSSQGRPAPRRTGADGPFRFVS